MNLEEMAQAIAIEFYGKTILKAEQVSLAYAIERLARQVEAETRKEKLLGLLPSEEERSAKIHALIAKKHIDDISMLDAMVMYDQWLRSKIQVPEPLSDEEISVEAALAGAYDTAYGIEAGFSKGARWARKRLLGDSTTSQLLASTSASNSDEKKYDSKKEEEKK